MSKDKSESGSFKAEIPSEFAVREIVELCWRVAQKSEFPDCPAEREEQVRVSTYFYLLQSLSPKNIQWGFEGKTQEATP